MGVSYDPGLFVYIQDSNTDTRNLPDSILVVFVARSAQDNTVLTFEKSYQMILVDRDFWRIVFFFEI